jgi:hypothetical protein
VTALQIGGAGGQGDNSRALLDWLQAPAGVPANGRTLALTSRFTAAADLLELATDLADNSRVTAACASPCRGWPAEDGLRGRPGDRSLNGRLCHQVPAGRADARSEGGLPLTARPLADLTQMWSCGRYHGQPEMPGVH